MASTPPTVPTPPGPTDRPVDRPVDPRDEAFLREVDEAYRKDELQRFFATWGRWIVLGLVVALAALGGWMWWKTDQAAKIEQASEQFSTALAQVEAGATTEAAASFTEIQKNGNPAYRSLAAMTEAGIAENGGDLEKAAKLLRGVRADTAAPQVLRDTALMKLLRVEFDKMPPAEILKETAPFLQGDSPWFATAGEVAAMAHLKAGDNEKAGGLFYRIAGDERAPASLRARAEQMAAALGQDVTKLAEAREQQQRQQAAAEKAEAK